MPLYFLSLICPRIFYIRWCSDTIRFSLFEGVTLWAPHPLRGPTLLHTHMGTWPAHWPWTLMAWRRTIYWRKKRRGTRQMQRWPRCTTTTPIPTHTLTIPRCTREGCCYEGSSKRLRPAWATWRAQWLAPWSTGGGRPLKRIMSLQGDPVQSAHQMDLSSLMPTLLKRLLQPRSTQASEWPSTPTHRARRLEEPQVGFIKADCFCKKKKNVVAGIQRK